MSSRVTGEWIVLLRDCDVVLVPDGQHLTLSAESQVRITQLLGGAFTCITGMGRLVRISGQDADALGLEIPEEALRAEKHVGIIDENTVMDQLRLVFDPEIPVNIVDLGLIYSTTIIPLKDDSFRVEVRMTLTAPGCGMAPVIQADAAEKVRHLPGVDEVNVEVVWDPPWSKERMSDAAKLQLGMF